MNITNYFPANFDIFRRINAIYIYFPIEIQYFYVKIVNYKLNYLLFPYYLINNIIIDIILMGYNVINLFFLSIFIDLWFFLYYSYYMVLIIISVTNLFDYINKI